MPSLTFEAAKSLSRVIRSKLSQGQSGKALISLAQGEIIPKPKARSIGKLTRFQKDEGPLAPIFNHPLFQGAKAVLDFLGKGVFNIASGFAGWVWKDVLRLDSINASSIWTFITSNVQRLWNFNWNASDKALQDMIKGQNLGLASIWGGVAGQSFGWLAAIGVGYGVSFLCPVIGGAALAKLVASKTSVEAVEEVTPALSNAIRSTIGVWLSSRMIDGYMNYRKLLKSLPEQALDGIFGTGAGYFIKHVWGNEGGATMSGASWTEETVESIPNDWWKRFTEAALEEAWDSFVEGGFIVANEIDNAYAQQKLSNQRGQGTERTIVIEPDKRTEHEKLTFARLPQNTMIATVQQTLNTHRLLHNRDVGMIIGQPIDEYVRAKPQSLRLIIRLHSVQEPPFKSRGSGKLTSVTLTIPDVKRSQLDWNLIKLACGGANGYLWGRFRATANLDNGRQMAVYGGTEAEAETRLKALLTLSDATLITLSVSEEKREGRRAQTPKLYKETTRVYPAYFTIVNRDEILDTNRGDASLKQNYIDRRGRIELWPDQAPTDSSATINRLLTRGA